VFFYKPPLDLSAGDWIVESIMDLTTEPSYWIVLGLAAGALIVDVFIQLYMNGQKADQPVVIVHDPGKRRIFIAGRYTGLAMDVVQHLASNATRVAWRVKTAEHSVMSSGTPVVDMIAPAGWAGGVLVITATVLGTSDDGQALDEWLQGIPGTGTSIDVPGANRRHSKTSVLVRPFHRGDAEPSNAWARLAADPSADRHPPEPSISQKLRESANKFTGHPERNAPSIIATNAVALEATYLGHRIDMAEKGDSVEIETDKYKIVVKGRKDGSIVEDTSCPSIILVPCSSISIDKGGAKPSVSITPAR